MRFTLKYRGTDLKSAGNSGGRIRQKQTLRAHFHAQLRRAWERSPLLSMIDRTTLESPIRVGDVDDVARPIKATRPPIAGFMFRKKIHNSWFIPIITGPMEAHCALNVRLGRPAKGGGILFAGGDLDGRLKTLFDSLSVPRDAHQVDVKDCPDEEYLCLLSDDSLITGLSIESHQLLTEQEENYYVDIDVDVVITAATPMSGTLALLYG